MGVQPRCDSGGRPLGRLLVGPDDVRNHRAQVGRISHGCLGQQLLVEYQGGEQPRARSDVEWVLGDLGSADWDREFDLVVMTGHAFQVFVEDAN